jgi:hypothetical protein
VNSSAAQEIIRVLTVNTGTNVITARRDVGGAGVDTIAANADLRIIGTAFEEGSTVPTSRFTQPAWKFNYTQIFRDTIDFSKTQCAITPYGVDKNDREREHKLKLKEHKIKLNAALLWGRKSEDLSGGPNGKPIRTCDGLNSIISSNVADGGGMLTKKAWNAFCRQAFRYGPKKKLLLCAPIYKEAFTEWFKGHLQVKTGEETYGVNAMSLETAFGRFLIVNDWMLENSANGNGYAGWAFAIDMENLMYRPLVGNGENRDTRIYENVIKDGRDAYVDDILTEATFQIEKEQYHAKMYNVTDYVG